MIDWIIALFTALILGFFTVGVSNSVPMSSSDGMPATAGEVETMFTGTVTGTIDDCAFDGICAFIVNESMEVIWTNGMMQCMGSMDNDIAVGDNVEVYAGTIFNDNGSSSFSICSDEEYYIRKQS